VVVAAGEAAEGAPGVKETEGPAAVGDERDLPISAGVEEAIVEPEASSVSSEKVRATVREEVASPVVEIAAAAVETAMAVETAAAQDSTAVEETPAGMEETAAAEKIP
jgi:hypothetical protein